eukprot:scaffold466220_cov38-Prasinocladus_malaysianus.AAC.1
MRQPDHQRYKTGARRQESKQMNKFVRFLRRARLSSAASFGLSRSERRQQASHTKCGSFAAATSTVRTSTSAKMMERRQSMADVVVHGPSYHAKDLAQLKSEDNTLGRREELIKRFFPDAYGVDDFMTRVEISLCNKGFTGRSSIGASCLLFAEHYWGGLLMAGPCG